MGNDKFLEICKEKVIEYFNNRSDKTDIVRINKYSAIFYMRPYKVLFCLRYRLTHNTSHLIS